MKYFITITICLLTQIAVAEPVLSWEAKDPKNKEWTRITLESITKRFDKLDKAEDIITFCPKYQELEKEKKIIVWGELISSTAFYESGWNPNSELLEPSLGKDAITGLVVQSQGLLQLSYGDTTWAKWCNFTWDEDRKNLAQASIIQPKNNLECGIGILANQVNRWKRITLDGKHAYWSVLKIDSKWKKIDNIAKMVKRLTYCN